MNFERLEATRDSSVRWLGQLPAHWGIVQSRRLFAERNEKACGDEQQLTASQKYGLIPQRDFMELEGRRIVQVLKGHDILKHTEAGDFVMSMRSFQGGLEYSGFNGSISSAYVPLKPIKWVWPGFFRYLFKSSAYIQELQSTSDLVRDGQALRFENFSKVPLPVVPMAEQKTIAVFLDRETSRIDGLIERKTRFIELLREKRQALITHAVTKGLDPGAPMKDSGVEWLGQVPAHWSVTKLRYLADFNPSPNWGALERGQVDCPFLPMEAIGQTGELDTSRRKRIADCRSGYSYFANGDITYAKVTPCFENGKGAVMDGLAEGFGFGTTELTVLRPRHIDGHFLYAVTSASFFREPAASAMTGTGGLKRVPEEFARDFRIAVPPRDEQLEICSYLVRAATRIDTLIANTERSIELLREKRSALITAAVTGKIDLRNAA